MNLRELTKNERKVADVLFSEGCALTAYQLSKGTEMSYGSVKRALSLLVLGGYVGRRKIGRITYWFLEANND